MRQQDRQIQEAAAQARTLMFLFAFESIETVYFLRSSRERSLQSLLHGHYTLHLHCLDSISTAQHFAIHEFEGTAETPIGTGARVHEVRELEILLEDRPPARWHSPHGENED